MMVEHPYTRLDRLVHRVAFLHPSVQMVAADVEGALFRKKYDAIPVAEPIFITSLPRCGTTLLLEALYHLPGFATSLYRDMPFVSAPILWNSFTERFKKPEEMRERAHGDGMNVGYDSPEAFEEVFWKLYWPKKYLADRIRLWAASDKDADFRRDFPAFMRKVIHARRRHKTSAERYVSKNNANLGRIPYLKALFPRCQIVLPFRHPMDHAISMLKQYRNFRTSHEQDPFARRYMEDLGHYEFGLLHRPIDFPGVERVTRQHTPEALAYWIGYWIAAFKHVLSLEDSVLLLGYESACADGRATMATLKRFLEVDDAGIETAAGLFRPARKHPVSQEVEDPGLLEEACELYETLKRSSIV